MDGDSLCVHLIGFHCVVPAPFACVAALSPVRFVEAAKTGCKTTEKGETELQRSLIHPPLCAMTPSA